MGCFQGMQRLIEQYNRRISSFSIHRVFICSFENFPVSLNIDKTRSKTKLESHTEYLLTASKWKSYPKYSIFSRFENCRSDFGTQKPALHLSILPPSAMLHIVLIWSLGTKEIEVYAFTGKRIAFKRKNSKSHLIAVLCRYDVRPVAKYLCTPSFILKNEMAEQAKHRSRGHKGDMRQNSDRWIYLLCPVNIP